MLRRFTFCVRLAICLFVTRAGIADEGMWTFDNFPKAAVLERYGVEVDDTWLDRIREGTLRLANCTASFVSPDGLILTNHHCAASCLAQHSSREQSLLETGFIARRRADELRCETQIADVLVETREITQRVQAAIEGLDATEANDERRRLLTQLEQSCEEQAIQSAPDEQRKCEAVTLYDGGQYFLYVYRRYDDVRLAFAPEAGIAAFGGDPDNFQFPRWCFDIAFLRAYVDGAPAKPATYLRIDFEGPEPNDPIFIAGHPGSTDRLLTVSQLKTIRDVDLPPTLLRAAELRGRYIQFAKLGAAEERIVRDPLFGLENGIKVRRKLLDALHADEMIASKQRQEAELEAWLAGKPELRAEVGDPWARIAAAQEIERAISLPYTLLERGAGFNSRLFRYARSLVRAAEERPKENTERLPEYADANLPRLEQQLRAAVPIYPELERLTLSFSLERMREWLGPDHRIVRQLLATESPDSLASRLVEGSALADPETRAALWVGGQAAIDASEDPMIELARDVDSASRAVRERYEDEVEAPVTAATEAIARVRFAAYGTEVYPDATFTLRLNFGSVQGWTEDGTAVDPITRLETLFERATGREPFAIPVSWLDASERVDLTTPFNVATNGDIVGGNSGSPLIDADGDIVGLMFDGNIHSISGAYWFDADKNRAIAVHAAIMLEGLSKVYDASALLRELRGG